MKFVKGLMVGSLISEKNRNFCFFSIFYLFKITTGVIMAWTDNDMTTKKITKKGKKWARKMGMI